MNHYTLSDISVGMTESFEVTVTEAMHNQFTAITGDVNPMHMDEEYARNKGYEHKLIYGMLTASFYSTLVGVYLPGENCVFHEIKTTFNAPVYAGDKLTVTGKVTEIHEGFSRITVKAHIMNQAGKKVSRAVLVVGCVEKQND